MKNEIITLVTVQRVKDNKGVYVSSTTKADVFAEIDSVNSSEFFAGGQNGLKPSLRFKINKIDYSKQTIVEYDNEKYSVYRTHIKHGSDDIELYAEKDLGI